MSSAISTRAGMLEIGLARYSATVRVSGSTLALYSGKDEASHLKMASFCGKDVQNQATIKRMCHPHSFQFAKCSAAARHVGLVHNFAVSVTCRGTGSSGSYPGRGFLANIRVYQVVAHDGRVLHEPLDQEQAANVAASIRMGFPDVGTLCGTKRVVATEDEECTPKRDPHSRVSTGHLGPHQSAGGSPGLSKRSPQGQRRSRCFVFEYSAEGGTGTALGATVGCCSRPATSGPLESAE